MLSKKPKLDTVNTIIGQGTKLDGLLTSVSSIRIDGEFKGEIETQATLHIGKDGIIHGNVKAASLTIEGFIEGNIIAEEMVQMVKGSQVVGDITSPSIEIELGAHFDGRSTMVPKSGKEKSNKGKQPAQAEKNKEISEVS